VFKGAFSSCQIGKKTKVIEQERAVDYTCEM
jgi:hypothetical protein